MNEIYTFLIVNVFFALIILLYSAFYFYKMLKFKKQYIKKNYTIFKNKKIKHFWIVLIFCIFILFSASFSWNLLVNLKIFISGSFAIELLIFNFLFFLLSTFYIMLLNSLIKNWMFFINKNEIISIFSKIEKKNIIEIKYNKSKFLLKIYYHLESDIIESFLFLSNKEKAEFENEIKK